MKNKKTLLIIIGIALIIVAAIILIVCKSRFFKSLNHNKKDAYQIAVENSYKVSTGERSYAEQYPTLLTNLLITDNVSYKIVKTGNTNMTVSITAPNMKDIMDGVVSETATFDDNSEETKRIQSYVINRLKDKDFKTVTNTVKVKIEREKDGQISIVPTEEYLDAVYGGLYSYYNSVLSKAKEK